MVNVCLESSSSLASGWLPGETLGNSNRIGCLVTACMFYCRNPVVLKFQFPRVSSGDQPLAKEPEDSGYVIVGHTAYHANFVPRAHSFFGQWLVARRLQGAEIFYRKISAMKQCKAITGLPIKKIHFFIRDALRADHVENLVGYLFFSSL